MYFDNFIPTCWKPYNAITVRRVRHNLFVAGKDVLILSAIKEGADTTDSREPPEAGAAHMVCIG